MFQSLSSHTDFIPFFIHFCKKETRMEKELVISSICFKTEQTLAKIILNTVLQQGKWYRVESNKMF